jgi:PKD repeat protein
MPDAFLVAHAQGGGGRHGGRIRPARRQGLLAGLVATVIVSLLAGAVVSAPALADSKPVDPSDPKTPSTVSADPLPAPQIDGVVWDQVVVGNTVYVGGKFTTARPAGSAAGKDTVPRSNFLAYNLTTGALLPFAPAFKGQVNTLAVSPDKKTLYVGGIFSAVTPSGATAEVTRYRLAAFTVATGGLVNTFAPNLNASVTAVVATASSVYVGGNFTSAQSTARSGLAALAPANAALQAWAPTPAGGGVRAMVVSPDSKKVVIGGEFSSLNGSRDPGFGLGAVTADTGTLLPWKVNSVIRNGGKGAAVYSLSADATNVYATAFSYYAEEQSPYTEGTYAARWSDGELVWHEDCHGDTYSAAPAGDVVYTAGHAHDCERVGGFGSHAPSVSSADGYYRALAFTNAATGTLKPFTGELYTNFAGQPAPSLLDWFPYFDVGSATGQWQGPWDVTVAGDYVLYAGEFTRASGKAQQGLVRFQIPSKAPNLRGPELSGADMAPSIEQLGAGSVRLSWKANYDPDNANLRYEIYRDAATTPVAVLSKSSRFWDRPELHVVDTGLTAGKATSYKIKTIDPFGNATMGAAVTVTPEGAGSTALTDYDRTVLGDTPAAYWPLNETAGTRAIDMAGTDDMTLAGSATRKTDGVEGLSGGYSSTFPGSVVGGIARERTDVSANVSTELWFSSTSPGRLLDFADQPESATTGYDVSLELRGDGRLSLAMTSNTAIVSPQSFADGRWHHVVTTLGPTGAKLVVDGVVRASDASNASTRPIIPGSWRLANGFPGRIDNVAVYKRSLSTEQIADHLAAGTGAADAAPVASFSHSADALTVAVDGSASSDAEGAIASWTWNFGDGQTGSGRTATHTYGAAGTYTVTLTVRDSAGATATSTASVVVKTPIDPQPTDILARDAFERTDGSSWGSADKGGSWSKLDGTTGFSVSKGAGVFALNKGEQRTSLLKDVSSKATDSTATFVLSTAPTGGGQFATVLGRVVGNDSYSGRVWVQSNGVPQLQVRRSGDVLKAVNLTGAYSAGTPLHVRVLVSGSGTTTIQAKAWIGATEPGAYQLTATDTTASLQGAGSVGLQAYVSGAATSGASVTVTDYSVSAITP